MRYQEYPPPPALAGYVRFFWIMEGSAGITDPGVYRLFANGCPELIFQYRNQFTMCADGQVFPQAHVYGQTQLYREMTVTGPFGIAGAYLYPYSMQAFFGLPGSRLADMAVDAACLAGGRTRELLEQIAEAPGDLQKVNVITTFLLQQLNRNILPDPGLQACMQQVLHTRGSITVEEMAQAMYISNRQFERKFLAATGLTPKLFARIVRFQSALRLHMKQPGSRIVRIAMDCGYSDHSHFIREFKAFSGFNPREYFRESPEDLAESFMRVS